MQWRGASLLLDLVTFHHSHHAFCEAVIAFGVIVLVEVEAKDKGESLPDVCSHRTDESFGNLVSRLIAFSVDKFHKKTSLRARESFDDRFIFLLQTRFHAIDVRLSFLFGERLNEIVSFGDDDSYGFGIGQKEFNVGHESVVSLFFLWRLKHHRWIFVDGRHDDVWNAVPFVEGLSHFHVHRNGRVHFAGVFGHFGHIFWHILGIDSGGGEECATKEDDA